MKGNFRKKAIDISYDAIGNPLTNWINGSNVAGFDRQAGGFLVASFASNLSGAGFLVESMFDLFSSTYGATLASNLLIGGSGGSSPQMGMKPFLTQFLDFSGDAGSNVIFYTLSATHALAGDDSVIVITPKKYAVSGPVGAASTVSVHFIMAGWIASVPFSFK